MINASSFWVQSSEIVDLQSAVNSRVLPESLMKEAEDAASFYLGYIRSLTDKQFEEFITEHPDNPAGLHRILSSHRVTYIETALSSREADAIGTVDGFRLSGRVELGKIAVSKIRTDESETFIDELHVSTDRLEGPVQVKRFFRDASAPKDKKPCSVSDFDMDTCQRLINGLPSVIRMYQELLALQLSDEDLSDLLASEADYFSE